MTEPTTIPTEVYDDALTLWNYHRPDHEPRPCSVGVGLGSHDPASRSTPLRCSTEYVQV
jgi:hypothetical protein